MYYNEPIKYRIGGIVGWCFVNAALLIAKDIERMGKTLPILNKALKDWFS